MASRMDPEERLEWLAQLKHQAKTRRARLLSAIGPNGRTPLHSVRVVEGDALRWAFALGWGLKKD
ncbi:MAG: hypothetical protein Q8R02_08950 [Hyphomonadaceae bacterium]|nr:hypothetical protein [Hyphomonadaceae bacterium]